MDAETKTCSRRHSIFLLTFFLISDVVITVLLCLSVGTDDRKAPPRGMGVQQRRLRWTHVPAQPPAGTDRHAQHAGTRM